jgi:hypothetical protein
MYFSACITFLMMMIFAVFIPRIGAQNLNLTTGSVYSFNNNTTFPYCFSLLPPTLCRENKMILMISVLCNKEEVLQGSAYFEKQWNISNILIYSTCNCYVEDDWGHCRALNQQLFTFWVKIISACFLFLNGFC